MNAQDQSNSFSQMAQTALSPLQYWGTLSFTLLGAVCLVSFLIWAFRQQKYFDPRFRLGINAGLVLVTVASASYLLIIYKLLHGYAMVGGLYEPHDTSLLAVPVRYLDWTITVPLLMVELIGVSALSFGRALWLRLAGMVSGFLMILCGYLGELATSTGSGFAGRVQWGLISSGFFVILLGIIIYTVRRSVPELTAAEGRIYLRATVLLLGIWLVYPIMYGINGFVTGGPWVFATQAAYCVADVVAKVGFGLLVFKVARLRSDRSKASA